MPSNRPSITPAVIRLFLLTAPAARAQGPIGNGENQLGTIAAPGEIDVWTYTAASAGTLIVSLTELVRTPDTNFIPWVQIRDGSGTLLSHDFDGLTAQAIVSNAPAGNYSISVLSNNAAAVGDYRLVLAHTRDPFITPAGDHGGAIVNGANQPGRIELGDLDIYTFQRQQTEAFVLSLTEVPPGGVDDAGFVPWVRVYGPNGALLVHDFAALTAQAVAGTTLLPLTGSGTYTVIVGTLTASGNAGRYGVADYLLRLAAVPGNFEVPVGDHGGPIANGARHTGRIELGDLDIWTFERQQTDGFILSLNEVPGAGGDDPAFVPWLRVYGPSGALLSHDFGALTAQVEAGNVGGGIPPLPASGTYTVIVGSLTASGNAGRDGVADYALTLAAVPGDIAVPVGDHGGAMTQGVNHPGRIELGDLDAWTFTACAGQQFDVRLTEGGPDLGFVPWLRVFNPAGTRVAGNAANGTAQVLYTPGLAGRYTVVVGTLTASGNAGRDGIGDYTIRVTGSCPPPVSLDDAYGTPNSTPLVVAAPGVMGNDTVGAAPISAAVVTGVGVGALNFAANGGFTYTPPAGFSGPVTFTYRVTNAAGLGNVATVTISVGAVPVPTSVADSHSITSGSTLTVPAPGILGNDTSNGGGTMAAQLVTTAAHGTLALAGDGGFSYTPSAGFVGSDVFTYRAVNSGGPGNTVTVSLTVSAAPAGPQPPTGLVAWSVVGNRVTLRWTPPAAGTTPTGYVMDGGVLPGQILASLATGGTQPVFTFTAPTGSFYVRVRTLAGAQSSAASSEIRIHVNVPVAPSPPANLLGLVNGSTLALSWRSTFAGGAPAAIILDVTGTLSASLPLGMAETFVFQPVPGGVYNFSVRAVNAGGVSLPSNVVTLPFPAGCQAPPQPPPNFIAYKTGNVISLQWDPPATGTAATGYTLHVGGSFTLNLPLAARSLSAPVGPGTYVLSVSAVNACGASSPTAQTTITVP